MLDIRWMRGEREALAEAMHKLNDTEAPWERALELDEQRRALLARGRSAARRTQRRLQADWRAVPRQRRSRRPTR